MSSATITTKAASQRATKVAPSSSSMTMKKRLKQKLANPLRWLHIYSSMFGLVAILFFSVTGFTLNHPDLFFSGAHHETTEEGNIELVHLKNNDDQVARLEIVEHLRKTHRIRASVEGFNVDDQEVSVAFRGPAYTADVYIDRGTGNYEVTQVSEGFMAIMNDLHRGRHTGPVWSLVIDITAITLSIVSLTGLGLLLYLKRRRRTGIILTIVTTVGMISIYFIFSS